MYDFPARVEHPLDVFGVDGAGVVGEKPVVHGPVTRHTDFLGKTHQNR